MPAWVNFWLFNFFIFQMLHEVLARKDFAQGVGIYNNQ